MGNKVSNPVPSYDTVAQLYSTDEIETAKLKFKSMCHQGQNTLRLENFKQVSNVHPLIQRRLLPRLFEVMDSKKENAIDFESYFCTLSLLHRSTVDEMAKFIFILYGTSKSSSLQRDNIRDLLIDSHASVIESNDDPEVVSRRLKGMADMMDGMVSLVLLQHASVPDKLSLSEFCAFVKLDSSVQNLISLLPRCLGENK
mmetsp:Transcript_7102/g.10594  ORF Transcript_7102/g.10594 Transcript_7102/m.10594 type:complete len:199 (+) Transcript_7102:109-705(+)